MFPYILTHDVPLLVIRVYGDEVTAPVVTSKELAVHPGVIPGQLGVHNHVTHARRFVVGPSLLIVTFIYNS